MSSYKQLNPTKLLVANPDHMSINNNIELTTLDPDVPDVRVSKESVHKRLKSDTIGYYALKLLLWVVYFITMFQVVC